MYPPSRMCIILLLLAIATTLSLEIIPELIKLTYVNEKYVTGMVANVRRYGRGGAYYVNVQGTLKHAWGDNVTMHSVVTEFLHNEYRPSFIELHYKLCDLINNEPYIGGMIKKKGISCPLPQGPIRLMNLSTPTQDFSFVWPFEKGGVDTRIVTTETNELLVSMIFHLKFVQKTPRRRIRT